MAVAGLAGCGGSGSVVLPLGATSLTPLALAANAVMGGLSIQLPPPAGSSPDIDISTISDFDGFIGRAVVDGSGLAGTTTLYYEADLAFMQGTFRATNGSVAHGTFSFVWIGIFSDAARSNQLHEINYGNGGMPGAATGLFWTKAVADADVQSSGGGALLELSNMPILDAFQIFTTPPVPARLTLRAQFIAGPSADLSTTSHGSTFAFVGSQATLRLSFNVISQVSRSDASAFTFASTGSGTTSYGRVGTERNGSFAST